MQHQGSLKAPHKGQADCYDDTAHTLCWCLLLLPCCGWSLKVTPALQAAAGCLALHASAAVQRQRWGWQRPTGARLEQSPPAATTVADMCPWCLQPQSPRCMLQAAPDMRARAGWPALHAVCALPCWSCRPLAASVAPPHAAAGTPTSMLRPPWRSYGPLLRLAASTLPVQSPAVHMRLQDLLISRSLPVIKGAIGTCQ